MIHETGFGEDDVEFSEQVVLLPRETALSLQEVGAPAGEAESAEGGSAGEGGQAGIGEGQGAETWGGVIEVMPTERFCCTSWQGEVPARQWMQLYTKVLSRFAMQRRAVAGSPLQSWPNRGH